ncbi:AraC family transcriptional regulator [Sphingomonas sp. G124]|uniref:AraC family transcriptional regulator n=1 Tax=Sphingomonas cremea TaxID=2904799 RepID=A0A9X1QHF3_9SPHN|nr:AraC family transcriptional regulator [Sphingomonas cremea]MCF2513495.1 AraC family transcriptional regulator [Sphingomonas cremea]
MSELAVRLLHETPAIAIRDILCSGTCRHKSAAECASATHLVFPYRGVFARHVGRSEAIGEANQLIFFNNGEEYSISHPADGGDACLSLLVAEEVLRELAPVDQVVAGEQLRFRRQHRGIDPNAQLLLAHLRHRLAKGIAEPLEVETIAFALVARALGERSPNAREPRFGTKRIVDRAKRMLASEPARRWTSTEIGREVGVSPVYLTQLFRQVEGVPLYRYHLRLRLARALDLLDRYDDLTMLGLDLGFSSHSHFTAAFRQAYGQTPRAFQRSAGIR